MANAYAIGGQVINITFDGSANDIDFTTYFPAGLMLQGIGFIASDIGDIFVLKEGSATGQVLAEILGTESFTLSPPLYCKPFLDISACTLATPANARAVLYYA